MRVFLFLFILMTFLAELTLDSSTAFVRADGSALGKVLWKKALPIGESASDGDAAAEDHWIVLGGSSHSALPAVSCENFFDTVFFEARLDSNFLIPLLAPPVRRIERPPIV